MAFTPSSQAFQDGGESSARTQHKSDYSFSSK